MKFAQYLQDTQVPEWKKAYIDYRGLKKRITAIRKSQQGLDPRVLSSDESPDESCPPNAPRHSDVAYDESSHRVHLAELGNVPPLTIPDSAHIHSEYPARGPAADMDHVQPTSFVTSTAQRIRNRLSATRGPGAFNFANIHAVKQGRRLSSWSGISQHHAHPFAALPLHEVLNHLTPSEVSFFTMLDAQLDKVEAFYLAREKEMVDRGRMLQIQLNELNDHRKLFYEAYTQVSWITSLFTETKKKLGLHRSREEHSPILLTSTNQPLTAKAPQAGGSLRDSESGASALAVLSLPTLRKIGKRSRYPEEEEDANDLSEDAGSKDGKKGLRARPLSADPDNYLNAKRKLKKAVLEHYRGLEVLHNYRVLNITGFRKALKKFEKVTKISVQQQYMTEKVEKSAFASESVVRKMMTQTEVVYAASFARGDKKQANKRLRTGGSTRTHHFSTFRAGVYLGLGIPAFCQGLLRASQRETQESVPAWDALLYIYGMILIPVLFSLLVGINFLVWAESRINYSFIFEFDVSTQIDHRKYFEIPAILLSTLFTAFWLSFNVLDVPRLSPTIWPLVWLSIAVFVVSNPLPFQSRPSRYWFIKTLARQFLSGMRHVDFTDFWISDQLCSLVSPFSSLYLFICLHVHNFSPEWAEKCSTDSSNWPIVFALAVLPLGIRLIQSLKRYYDSSLITHLINGGKYGSGIISSLFYYLWRHSHQQRGEMFVLWCLSSVISSGYGLAWDLLMDWTILKGHCEYPLLRPELVYTNHVPLYYFAIVSNTVIRFLWVIYIPERGPSILVRTFILAFLEMLRRWQWNFFRLENEHLGNMDQYRVTREVPLPYACNDIRAEDGDDEEDQHLKVKR